MAEFPFFNAHTHRPGEGVSLLDAGERLPFGESRADGTYYSVGVHPMRLAEGKPVDWTAFRACLSREGVLAVGECGLDRRLPLPLREQEEAFRRQAEMAEEVRLPVVIHCVRAFPELMKIRRDGHFAMPWLIHGYNNNGQILRRLLDSGFRISLGNALLHPASNASLLLPEIPLERLFLETDDRATEIRSVYEAAALRLGMGMEPLKQQLWTNFNNVFYGMDK